MGLEDLQALNLVEPTWNNLVLDPQLLYTSTIDTIYREKKIRKQIKAGDVIWKVKHVRL